MDTFLNVGKNNLLENVQACWKSAKSQRAKAYAEQRNLSPGSVAVIVQCMIQSDVSGVAFSVHPVAQNHGQAVIEAVQGLGEQLVSGTVTPDNYVVDKRQNQVVEANLAGMKAILGDKEVRAIAKETTKIEGYFGFPVDIEWAIAKDRLFILQSRPITTL
jgi:pyruvate,water dikinase